MLYLTVTAVRIEVDGVSGIIKKQKRAQKQLIFSFADHSKATLLSQHMALEYCTGQQLITQLV